METRIAEKGKMGATGNRSPAFMEICWRLSAHRSAGNDAVRPSTVTQRTVVLRPSKQTRRTTHRRNKKKSPGTCFKGELFEHKRSPFKNQCSLKNAAVVNPTPTENEGGG